jgi:hypothetical protein
MAYNDILFLTMIVLAVLPTVRLEILIFSCKVISAEDLSWSGGASIFSAPR